MKINLQLDKGIFNDVYFPCLFDYKKRYEVYYGSAGSGKSQFVFQKILIKALNQKRKVLVVRKVAKTHLNSTFQMCIDILSQFKMLNYCGINRSTLTITLPSGSAFLFVGMDDPEKIKSVAGITDIVCEEATELTLDDVSQLDLRLRAKAPYLQTFYMFNPTSKANWVYKKWFDKDAVVDEETTTILRTTYKDNRFLPKEYTDALEDMKRTNPTYYKIYALGEFASLDKLVFTNWKVEEFEPNKSLPLLAGMDFGFVNDLSTLIFSLMDEVNKKIYVFKSWGSTGKTNNQLADVITNLGFSKSVIIADSAEQKSIEELRQLGIRRIKPATKGKGSILQGIQKLQQYEIIVSPECEGVITELQNYSWKKDKNTNEYINEPIDEFNHYMDALRYSLQCVENAKLKTANKSALGF